jgi:regulator of sigma E protease
MSERGHTFHWFGVSFEGVEMSPLGGYGVGWAVIALGFGAYLAAYVLGTVAAAASLGVEVEEASVGFGPRLLRTRWRGTWWTLSALPLGASVKLTDEDDLDRLEGAQRVLVLSAGHLLTLFAGVLVLIGHYTAGATEPQFLTERANIGWIRPGSALERGGLRPGDQIIALTDGAQSVTTHTWRQLLQAVARANDRPLVLDVRREGRDARLAVPSSPAPLLDLAHRAPSTTEEPTQAILLAPGAAVGRAISDGVESLPTLRRAIFRTAEFARERPQPDTGYARLVAHRFTADREVLVVVGLLGVLVGLLNLIPIPPLSGGVIAIACLETIRGRPFSAAVKEKLLLAGFALIVSLAVAVIYAAAQ